MNIYSRSNKQVDSLHISLTFDDGYISHYTLAKYLSKIGVKATFFITTHLKEKRFLASTPNRIAEISQLGHEIGSHTCTHPNLLLLSRSEREFELRESKKWLENLLGKSISSFAYPYFLYDDKVLRDTHKFYFISRSRYLHVGSNKIDVFHVDFLTRKNVLDVLGNSIFSSARNSALVVLHDIKPFQIVPLLSFLKFLKQTIHRQIRFLTVSELALLLSKESVS